MLMIVIFHSVTHGIFDFPSSTITVNKLWYQFLLMQGLIGNNIFVLISGYFLVKSPGVNFRRMFNLWTRIVFYALAVFALSVWAEGGFSVKGLLKCLLPVTHRRWWFASTYFLMYLLHPYINVFLRAMSRDEYRKFLFTAGFYFSIIPLITKSEFGYSELSMFIYLYALAGYVRLWADDWGSRKYILFGIGLMGLNFLTALVLDVAGLKFSFAAKNSEYFLFGGRPGMMRPLNILSALCMFVGFKKLNMPSSRTVNIVASATLGVYMLHENGFSVRFLWRETFRFPSFQGLPAFWPCIFPAQFWNCCGQKFSGHYHAAGSHSTAGSPAEYISTSLRMPMLKGCPFFHAP